MLGEWNLLISTVQCQQLREYHDLRLFLFRDSLKGRRCNEISNNNTRMKNKCRLMAPTKQVSRTIPFRPMH